VPVLKTARSWALPPLTLLTGKKSDWSDERNRLLAVALTILEDETCSQCGVPVWLGHSSNNEIEFEVHSSICFSCADLEKDREDRGRKPKKGETRYAIARNVWGDDVPLPSRFDSYMEEFRKEEQRKKFEQEQNAS